MLTAQAVSSTGHWPSLLPTLRMEYMQRVHSTTTCLPNGLLFPILPKLPPPVGALHWMPKVAPLLSSAPSTLRDQAAQHAHHEGLVLESGSLDTQRRNLHVQAQRLAAKRRRGRKPHKIGFSLLRGA
jgi:hypothetical protein